MGGSTRRRRCCSRPARRHSSWPVSASCGRSRSSWARSSEVRALGAEQSPRPRPRTLATLIADGAQRWGASAAIIFEDRVVSYAELSDEVDGVAAGLLALGVQHGDRVAVLFGNRPEWLFAR